MLFPSNYRKDKPLSDLKTGSSNEVDVMAAASSPLTNLCASAFPEDGVVAKRGCDCQSSSPTCTTSPSLGRRSITSTSLDADDEAEEHSPANPLVSSVAPSPLPALKLGYSHPPQAPLDSYGDASQKLGNGAGEVAEASPTKDTDRGMHDQQPLSGCTGADALVANGSASLQTFGLRRSRKRSSSSSSPRVELERSDTSPHSSPVVPLTEFLLIPTKACGSSVDPTSTATATLSGEGAPAPFILAGGAVSCESAPIARARCLHDDSDCITNESGASSPPVPSSSLTTPAAKLMEASSSQQTRGGPLSPLAMRLQPPSWPREESHDFGCCVFFFPAPFVSWLFPFVGHVAISNAEGSRLYTFESSYYVREEKLASVLDRVMRGESQTLCTASSMRESLCSESRVELSALLRRSPKFSQSLEKFGGGDASVSDETLTSSFSTAADSLLPKCARSPVSSLSSARPPRRAGRQRSGHAHTQCVRIWDLKPLLMEGRGRRTRRTPHGFTTQGGRLAAAMLWEHLQGLLQPTEVAAPLRHGAAMKRAVTGTTSSLNFSTSSARCLCTSVYHSDDADGVYSAPGMSSSSGEEEGRDYELLDAETARFYNRNLHATIRLFRGSADGSINSPDVVLQHHSSFSFVGFVLEACGVGSQKKLSSAAPASTLHLEATVNGGSAPTAEGPCSASARAGSASVCDDVVPGESPSSDEEIHWGMMKLLFHVSVFGKWHRGERRLCRVVHGGSITSAAILWVVIIALAYHYLKLLFL
ncbi:hypothetical protein JKF63_02651 [Porcisia hertigi]|uniref:Transmembrane protein n=1 Tax=Porcisia hertigi TaxID=2761500 RepID=A0A836HP16_9TRYP|nr:hypothetical protein JKF63_02651 [Porcisia hertigi]